MSNLAILGHVSLRIVMEVSPLGQQVRYKPTLDIEAMFTTLANQLGPQPLFNVRTICGWVKTCQNLLVYQYLREYPSMVKTYCFTNIWELITIKITNIWGLIIE